MTLPNTDLHILLKEILETGYLLSLASVDTSGPWVSDVIYTYDSDLNLYWVSQLKSRHSKAFAQNSKAAGSITVVEKPEGQATGVQLEGAVFEVDAIPPVAHKRYSLKRNRKELWQLAPQEQWYKLTPTKFDLIYEPLFGFTKKSLSIT